MKKNILVLLVFVLLAVVRFWHMLSIFFIQDEWFVFGTFYAQGLGVVASGLDLARVGHITPLSKLLSYIVFLGSGVNSFYYNLIGIFIHITNTVLVYLLARKLIYNRTGQIVAPLVFLSSNIGYEQIAWPIVSINALSLLLVLLTWYLSLKSDEVLETKRIWIIALALLLAVLIVENALAMFLFISIFIILKNKKKVILPGSILPVLLTGALYLTFRVLLVLYNTIGDSTNRPSLYLLPNLVEKTSFPIRYLAQVFIPQDFLYKASEFITVKLIGYYDLVDQSRLVEGVIFWRLALVLGASIFFFLIFISLSIKKRLHIVQPTYLIALIFIMFSSLPFILVPSGIGNFPIIASRYLYFGLVGSSLILAVLYGQLLILGNKFLKYLATIFIISIIIFGLSENWNINKKIAQQGIDHRGILNAIKQQYPALPLKIVFYTESDSSFYGLPPEERILPFQSGLGQTLLVWYNQAEDFPPEFFQDRFLWEITDQGYQEADGRGFGYFRDFGLLARTVQKLKIPPSSIIAFRYDSRSSAIEDNTVEVQGRVKGFLAEKRMIKPRQFLIYSSQNTGQLEFVFDGNRETLWDSKLSYENPQFVELDLGRIVKVAQIEIDSYNNRNQNEVGYRVLLSNDREKWHEGFYAKRYPPHKNGIVDLFIKPTRARYIKIEQIGYHEFASWVIHELSLYEEID